MLTGTSIFFPKNTFLIIVIPWNGVIEISDIFSHALQYTLLWVNGIRRYRCGLCSKILLVCKYDFFFQRYSIGNNCFIADFQYSYTLHIDYKIK